MMCVAGKTAHRAGLCEVLVCVPREPRAHEHVEHIMHVFLSQPERRHSPCEVGVAAHVHVVTRQQPVSVGVTPGEWRGRQAMR